MSRPILPRCRQAFRTMSDDDLKAVFAHLRSIRRLTIECPIVEPPVSATGSPVNR